VSRLADWAALAAWTVLALVYRVAAAVVAMYRRFCPAAPPWECHACGEMNNGSHALCHNPFCSTRQGEGY